MKTRSIQNTAVERLIHSGVLNELVFIQPRALDEVNSLEKIYIELEKDFLSATRKLVRRQWEGRRTELFEAEFGTEKASDFLCLDPKKYKDTVDMVKAYLRFFSLMYSGKAFTGFFPKIIAHENDAINGFNCLGKAAAFGSFMKMHGISTRLALVSDHAVVIVELQGEVFLCDPTGWKFFKMHGTFKRHDGYEWYSARAEDEMAYTSLVVQSFSEGVLNAILETFQSLRQMAGLSAKEKRTLYSKRELRIESVNDPKWGYRELIIGTDWKGLRDRLFGSLNSYGQDYPIQLLLEAEHVRKYRRDRLLSEKVDLAVIQAVKAVMTTSGSIREFNRDFLARMKPYAEPVVSFLGSDTAFGPGVPEDVKVYTATLKANARGRDVRRLVLQKMRAKLA